MYTSSPVNMDDVTKRAAKVLTGCTSAHFHKSFMDFGPVFFIMFSNGSVRVFSARRASIVDKSGYYQSWAFNEVRYVLTEV